VSKPITKADGVSQAAEFDPTSAQAAVMQATFATSVLPSMEKLAVLDFPANIVTLQTFDAVSRLADVYRMPIMAQLIEGITPTLTAASVLQASGIMSRLDGIVAAFAPQRVTLDAIAAAQLGQHSVFRDQMLQILSAQSSILTAREQQVAELISEGLSNRAIAERPRCTWSTSWPSSASASVPRSPPGWAAARARVVFKVPVWWFGIIDHRVLTRHSELSDAVRPCRP
jgi:hypothetical protein